MKRKRLPKLLAILLLVISATGCGMWDTTPTRPDIIPDAIEEVIPNNITPEDKLMIPDPVLPNDRDLVPEQAVPNDRNIGPDTTVPNDRQVAPGTTVPSNNGRTGK